MEFDEANLIALSRFPEVDRRERGAFGAVGLRWLRQDPSGWRAGLTVGRVWRDAPNADFSASSGLQGAPSDWLISGQIAGWRGLSLSARSLFDTSFDVAKAEARAAWTTERSTLAASYVLLPSDLDEDRPDPLSEWNLDASYDLNRYWTANTNWRYDLSQDELARAGFGLDYKNECIEVGFSVSRDFATASTVEASTEYGLTVALRGFGTGPTGKEVRRSCNAQ